MKMKKAAMLLTALALGAFAAHASAETICSGDYETVWGAFYDLKDGDTLILTDDCGYEDQVDIREKKVILDLNGHTLTCNVTDHCGIHVLCGGDLTVKDGTNSSGKIILKGEYGGFIDVIEGTFTLESGKIESLGMYAVSASTGNARASSFININGGTIEAGDEGMAVAIVDQCKFNMSGGTIKGGIAAMGVAMIEERPSKIKISGGTVDGGLVLTNGNDFIEGDGNKNTFEITGGTFTSERFKAYVDEILVRDLGNGSYAVGAEVDATVTTENAVQKALADTAATGFITTISSNEVFDLKTIKWDVTYNGTTKSTNEYNLGKITLNGDAKIGLAVGGFADAEATAEATVNGYIK